MTKFQAYARWGNHSPKRSRRCLDRQYCLVNDPGRTGKGGGRDLQELSRDAQEKIRGHDQKPFGFVLRQGEKKKRRAHFSPHKNDVSSKMAPLAETAR